VLSERVAQILSESIYSALQSPSGKTVGFFQTQVTKPQVSDSSDVTVT
jgi:hypothetical protein